MYRDTGCAKTTIDRSHNPRTPLRLKCEASTGTRSAEREEDA